MIKHPISRRTALGHLAAGIGVAPMLQGIAARAAAPQDSIAKRFVFIVRSNGILPTEIQPQGLESLVRPRGARLAQSKAIDRPLSEYSLSRSLSALEPYKDRVTIVQGLSGRMANASHGASFGALGAYRSGKGGAPPLLPTVDGALSVQLNSLYPHLGLAMEQTGPQVVYTELFAAATNRPLPCYADPWTAYSDLFGGVVDNKELKAAMQVDRNVLDFMAGDIVRFQKRLPQHEKEKLDHYLDGFEALRDRRSRQAAMAKQLRAAAPKIDKKYQSEVETDRLDAHFALATSALIGGLTQVVAIRADHLGMRLTGLGLGTKTVHHIGHMIEGDNGGNGGQDFENGMGEFDTRNLIMDYHMNHIAEMCRRLSEVPEGNGSMMDNTVIVYLSDHGEKHHSTCFEWPMVVVGNIDNRFRTGRYLHVPTWGEAEHRTIAHLYTSLLHAAGVQSDSFGQPDLTLPDSIDQTGPLPHWMNS